MNGQAMGGRTVASTVALAGAGDEAAFSQLIASYHADMARVDPAQTATQLHDGHVLVAGGNSSERLVASAEIYGPATGTFSPTKPQ